MFGRARSWQLGLLIVVVALALLAPIVGRSISEGRRELQYADDAAAHGDIDLEVMHLGRAARWRVPGTLHRATALARLSSMAREYEVLGDTGLEPALAARREIRRALISTRVVEVSHPELLADANRAIARLMARQEQLYGLEVGHPAARVHHHLALLSAPTPGPSWLSLVAALGFPAWLAGIAAFARYAIADSGRLRARRAWLLGPMVLGIGGLWLWATRFAVPDYIDSLADRSPGDPRLVPIRLPVAVPPLRPDDGSSGES